MPLIEASSQTIDPSKGGYMSEISYNEQGLMNKCKELVLYADAGTKQILLRRLGGALFIIMILVTLCIVVTRLMSDNMNTHQHASKLHTAQSRLEKADGKDSKELVESSGNEQRSEEPLTSADTAAKKEQICVHVAGSVKQPGLYCLSSQDRVNDALQAAGGLTDDADESQINLAAHVKDGMRLYIPHTGESAGETNTTLDMNALGESGEQSPSGLINLNTADVKELTNIPGIGEKTAQKIFDNRSKQGKFGSIDDLTRVPGIGSKKLESIRPYVTVTP